MKKLNYILGILGLGLFLGGSITACSPDYETDFEVRTLVVPDKSLKTITLNKEGGNGEIVVNTNVPFDDWTAESNAEWCKIERQKDKVLVSAGANTIYVNRQARIVIKYGHQSYAVDVIQLGLQPTIIIGEGEDAGKEDFILNTESKAKDLRIPVVSNLKLDNIVVPDTCSWVRFEGIETAPATRADGNALKQYMKFSMAENTDTIVRYCNIVVQSSSNYSFVGRFLIKQHESGYLVRTDDAHKEYHVGEAGETITIPLSVNGPQKAYTYEIEASAQSWIKPAPATRAMRNMNESFMVMPNDLEQDRVGRITFTSADNSETLVVTVTQDKFVPVPPENVKNVTATPGNGFITLHWDLPEKVNYAKLKVTYDSKVDGVKTVELNNSATEVRIDSTFKCAGTYSFTIESFGPTGMKTNDPVTVQAQSKTFIVRSTTPIHLTESMIKANATQMNDGQRIPGLIDDNPNTFYHTLWSGASPGKKPHFIQITLPEAITGCRVAYVSRNGSNGAGDVTKADMYTNTQDTSVDPENFDQWHKEGTLTFPLPAGRGKRTESSNEVIFDSPTKYIRFIPTARRDADPIDFSGSNGWWNMADFYLYSVDTSEKWAKSKLGISE